MPPADQNNAPFDYRPVGAAAAAGLPTASLLEYLLYEYPQYKKILESAEDATLPNGNVDLRKVMEKIQPGDFGLSGLQGGGDTFTDILVRGSHTASGGPGAHGQVAGPYVRPHWKLTNTPEGELGPALSFLMNDRGELYSPEMASNPKAWRKRVAGNAKDMTGTQRYGNYKEYLRSRTKQLAELKARERAWSTYDDAVRKGVNAPQPQVPRPDANAIQKLQQAKTTSVSRLKSLLGDIAENSGNTQTGELYRRGQKVHERWRPTSETGFFGGPRTDAKNFERQLEYITGKADRQEALAKRFDELAAKNPKLKQIAADLRMTDGERWDRLAKNLEARGLKTPAQKQTVESLIEAAGGNPNALLKSKLFKPKQFETVVPSLLHGGMSATNAGQTPVDYIFSNAPEAAKDVADGWWRRGWPGLRVRMRNWLDNYKYNTSPEGLTKEIQEALDRRPQELVPHWGDTVYKHTVTEGSSQNPRGYYRDPKTTPVGQKPTLWMRAKETFGEKEFLEQAKRMGVDPYDAAGAGNTAVSEVLGLNRFRRLFGGDCRGGHCGAGPARMFGNLFKGRFSGAPSTYLPNRVALSDVFEPVLVTHKAQALRDLTKGFRGRAAAGLGAMGLMGAAGYGLTGLGQGLLRSPKLPPQPKLDPHMFAKSMKLLQPQQRI